MNSCLLGSTLDSCTDSTVALDSCHSGSVTGALSGDMTDSGMEDKVVVCMRVVPRTTLLLNPRVGTDTVGVGGLQSFLPDDRPCILLLLEYQCLR